MTTDSRDSYSPQFELFLINQTDHPLIMQINGASSSPQDQAKSQPPDKGLIASPHTQPQVWLKSHQPVTLSFQTATSSAPFIGIIPQTETLTLQVMDQPAGPPLPLVSKFTQPRLPIFWLIIFICLGGLIVGSGWLSQQLSVTRQLDVISSHPTRQTQSPSDGFLLVRPTKPLLTEGDGAQSTDRPRVTPQQLKIVTTLETRAADKPTITLTPPNPVWIPDTPLTSPLRVTSQYSKIVTTPERRPTDKPTITLTPPNLVWASPDTYDPVFHTVAAQYEFDWQLLRAIAYVESRFNRYAIGQDGAMGLMQISQSTWQSWSGRVGIYKPNPYNPYHNVKVGAAYLAYLRSYCMARHYHHPKWMLVAYNWGPSRINHLAQQQGTWVDVPDTQRDYVTEILQRSGLGTP